MVLYYISVLSAATTQTITVKVYINTDINSTILVLCSYNNTINIVNLS